MKLKINDKIICIPPFISSTWEQVSFLHTEPDPISKELILIIRLADGKVIAIPHLDTSIIDIIFAAHLKYLEQSSTSTSTKGVAQKSSANFLQNLMGISPDQIGILPIRLGSNGIGGIEGLESAFQHNPAQSDTPPLPKEIISKIAAIARIMTNGDLTSFPKAEPHCNCMHCQIARAVHDENEVKGLPVSEESVTEEDLKFRSWDIVQSGDKLFTVTNPLDPHEQYSVFLGTPVGCTCGEAHCEHIKAVLAS